MTFLPKRTTNRIALALTSLGFLALVLAHFRTLNLEAWSGLPASREVQQGWEFWKELIALAKAGGSGIFSDTWKFVSLLIPVAVVVVITISPAMLFAISRSRQLWYLFTLSASFALFVLSMRIYLLHRGSFSLEEVPPAVTSLLLAQVLNLLGLFCIRSDEPRLGFKP